MRFPSERIRFVKSLEGKVSEKGYLVLDLKGLDTEGVNSLALDFAEIDRARAMGDREDEAKRRARELLGG